MRWILNWHTWLFAIGTVTLVACSSDPMSSVQQGKLDNTLRLYEGIVRWGALERVYGFLSPVARDQVKVPTNLGNVRVMSYETALPPTPMDKQRMQQTVVIQYVLEDQQVVKTISDQQIWEFDPETKNWYRSNPIPAFQ